MIRLGRHDQALSLIRPNNMTRNVSLADPTFTAMVKGLVAGVVNLTLALALGATLPAWRRTQRPVCRVRRHLH
jgi:hypothetical protein